MWNVREKEGQWNLRGGGSIVYDEVGRNKVIVSHGKDSGFYSGDDGSGHWSLNRHSGSL